MPNRAEVTWTSQDIHRFKPASVKNKQPRNPLALVEKNSDGTSYSRVRNHIILASLCGFVPRLVIPDDEMLYDCKSKGELPLEKIPGLSRTTQNMFIVPGHELTIVQMDLEDFTDLTLFTHVREQLIEYKSFSEDEIKDKRMAQISIHMELSEIIESMKMDMYILKRRMKIDEERYGEAMKQLNSGKEGTYYTFNSLLRTLYSLLIIEDLQSTPL